MSISNQCNNRCIEFTHRIAYAMNIHTCANTCMSEIWHKLKINLLPFYLTQSDTTHRVTQFHYLSWPDHGVPSTPTPLLNLRSRVMKHAEGSSQPTLVHCRYAYCNHNVKECFARQNVVYLLKVTFICTTSIQYW